MPASGSAVLRRRRFREAVAPHANACLVDAAGHDVVPLAGRGDEHERRARRHPAAERRVEHALEPHLAQPGAEHPDRLEDVRHAAGAAPGGGERRERVAEADDVRDVRSWQAPQDERQRRREPHPAVAQRRPEVRDPGAADDVDVRSARRPPSRRRGASSSAPRRRGPARRCAARARRAPRPARRRRGRASTRGLRRECGVCGPRELVLTSTQAACVEVTQGSSSGAPAAERSFDRAPIVYRPRS